MEDIPKHVHDSPCCVFLGNFEEYDLYWCEQKAMGIPTVIARYGEDGDYTSGMIFADRNLSPPLVEAKRRAMERGLRCERLPKEESVKTASD